MPSEYLSALRAEGTALAEQAGADLSAPVAACPGWSVADCVEHTSSVHRWVEHTVRTGERIRRRDMPGPGGGDVLAWYRDGLAGLLATLEATDPAATVWTFAVHSASTAGWWRRRMLQETAMHRWDVEAAVTAAPAAFPPAPAADGVDEYLADFLPDEELGGLTGTLHLHATDTDGEWFVDLADAGAAPRHEHGKADTALRGAASDLLLWLWNRQPADGRLEVFGDRAVVQQWTQICI